jgi:hypothetical protein
MPFTLYINDTCPKCGEPIWQTTIDQHPSRADLAVYNYHCADCGAVQAKVISLKPGRTVAEAAA